MDVGHPKMDILSRTPQKDCLCEREPATKLSLGPEKVSVGAAGFFFQLVVAW